MNDRSVHPLFAPLVNQRTLGLEELRRLEATGLAAGLPLMQRAGRAVAEFVVQQAAPGAKITALVGPGNNGGDALVAAKLLHEAGYIVTVVMPSQTKQPPKDAEKALADWQLTNEAIATDRIPPNSDLVIDGLFGIGLTRDLGQPWQGLIDDVNHGTAPVLALDIPSGLQAETGKNLGRPIKAKWTLGFIAPTPALRMPTTARHTGVCFVANLGFEP